MKCLEKEPARRSQSAADLVADLERFLRGEPTIARPIGPLKRCWRWARRHAFPAGLLTLLIVEIVGTGITIMLRYRNALENAEKARQNAIAANERRKTAREAIKAYTAAADHLFRYPDQAAPEEREALAKALELNL